MDEASFQDLKTVSALLDVDVLTWRLSIPTDADMLLQLTEVRQCLSHMLQRGQRNGPRYRR